MGIDCVLLDIVGGIVSYPLEKKFGLSTAELLEQLTSGGREVQQALTYILLYATLLTVLWGLYFTCFLGVDGQTPGKKLLGVRVVRVDGEPMDYKTAFNRFAGYSVSGSVFFLGFIWALFDRNQQTWHDKMAHTIVVRKSS
ncbi:MAG: RDD family protein [Nitrospinae bacterium]|nr:RDD family protein [Nitrospinota bacterium]